MKQHRSRRARARSLLYVSMALGAVALASGAWADGLSTPDALNMKLLGHSDMQGRPIYQPTVHKYPSSTAATATRRPRIRQQDHLLRRPAPSHRRRRLRRLSAESA